MSAYEDLVHLGVLLETAPPPRADQCWGGADVVITEPPAPEPQPESFYPKPRYVATVHARELSWLFMELRDVFFAAKLIDGCSKIEFFGRLANAANRCLRVCADASATLLCEAVLHEAFAILEEMMDGTFRELVVAVGGEIADDYVDDAMRSGFIGPEATAEFLASIGVAVNDE